MNAAGKSDKLADSMTAMGRAARAAARHLALSSGDERNEALLLAAERIRQDAGVILAANDLDMQKAAKKGLSGAMLDRLRLDETRVQSMAAGLAAIAELPDPLGRILQEWQRPNGLGIQRVSVPLGVIGIVYESRPNVTADAAGLCLKSGNAVILRGGSESFSSSHAIHQCMVAGVRGAGLDAAAVQMVPTTDRAAVGYLLASMAEYVDVLVPRGGKSLIMRVQEDARVPVIGHLDGICHVYLHDAANAEMAVDIVRNAKMRRTGICGAAETILVDRNAAGRLVPGVVAALVAAGCEVRADASARELAPDALPVSGEDWGTEYLDAIVSLGLVDDIDAAIAHIGHYGSGHTECIVTDDAQAAQYFFERVDSAILLHNASTQFADGGEFGMGAEIGIATGRVHARGPVGAEQLTSYKYLVRGSGQTRP